MIYDAVKLCTCNGRCAKYHRLLVSYLLAVGATLEGDGIVVATKLLEIIVIRYVASADAAFGIVYYHVDGQTVELVQFAILWQQVELVYWVTSNVLTSVTIGTGDFIHIWNAHARLVSLGFTSCFIVSIYTFCAAKITIADETTKHFWGNSVDL